MTMHVHIAVLLGALAGGATVGVLAAPQAAPASDAQVATTPAPPYAYDPQGRRDPFVSLLSRGNDPRAPSSRPAGVSGVLIGEVTVKGVVRDRSGFIAMIQGADRRTFIVRPGEALMDGSIKAITADGVVFTQDVNDPLTTVTQTEVRKTVRPVDGS